jgi:CRISPR-associated protein Csd1
MRDGTANATLLRDAVPTRFFILGLSPNASRLSVRFWVEEDAAELERRLSEHVNDLGLVGGRQDRPLPLWRIVAATGRAERDSAGKLKGFDTKGVSPQLAGDLARSVLTGAAYPQSLLATMIRRIRSDSEVAFARVSAIKACLVRNSRLRGAPLEVPVELNETSTDVAYRCGRLFALLEKAQSDSAGGDLNSTIKDRYFSAATATPALVFPRLFRLNGHHLAKLEVGSKIFYERQIASSMTGSFEFPRQLSLIEQGRFIVGYFQQRQHLFTKKVKTPQEPA